MKILILFLIFSSHSFSQSLHLPPRNPLFPTGKEFAQMISSLPRDERENLIFDAFISGNISAFLRYFVPIKTRQMINGTEYTLEYYVSADYLSIGNDSDYFYSPMTPILAQRIADATECILPTKKIVDQIYSAAERKLRPQPIPPDTNMTKVPRFIQHNDSVQRQIKEFFPNAKPGQLIAGHKKDIIIHQKIYSELRPNRPKPVVIYGWHQLNGEPIQPPNNWHQDTYVDYSHGVRLVQKMAKINGAEISLIDILRDETYHILISDDVLEKPYYEK